jgi:hypothetical protein
MLQRTRTLSFVLATGVCALALAACSQEPKAAALVGTQVDNFLLVDQTGIAHSLKYDKTAPAVVLVSQVNGDEGSRKAATQLAALQAKYPNVVIKMINSDPKDGREAITAEATAQKISVPVLDDEFQLVGDALGVTYAGEAFAIDPKTWKVAYHGPVEASKGGLDAALAEMTAGKPVTVAEVGGKGVAVAFADRANKAEFTKISYANDVAPILLKRCADCHEPGGIAPWSMTSYEVVKGYAPMMREAIRTDRMPPYDVDRHVNAYQNDENLTEAETKTLVHWIEAGAPRGEGDDPLLKGVTQRAEWPLGKPDLVMNIPSYDIPASGVVDYQMPALASPLKEGKWLKATTFKAGSRQGVHHILAGWLPKVPANGRGFDWKISMGGYAVGSESNFAPANWATWIPPGGAISFQMHYTPFGKAITDNSRIGFYFGPEPELIKRQIVIADPTITITPGEARHHEVAYIQFPADVQLYATQVHAHYRGYASKLTAMYPDGTSKVLLNMPKYDFQWQREYIYKDLIDLPAGTKLVADYWYDNSPNNPANPDPKKLVEWGDQSFEEMLFTGVQFRWKDETAKHRRDDLQEQLEASTIFTAADDNMDGLLQESELKSQAFADFKANFAKMDADKNGGISGQEFGAAMKQMEEAQRQKAKARQQGAAGAHPDAIE